MNLIKTLSVIGLIVAASAAPVDSSSDKLLASIRRTSKEFENVNARTANIDTRDFEDFVQGAENTGEDIKDFFSGQKRDWIDDASNFFNNMGDAFSGQDDKQKRDWIDDVSQFGENVKDAFEGKEN